MLIPQEVAEAEGVNRLEKELGSFVEKSLADRTGKDAPFSITYIVVTDGGKVEGKQM